MSGPQSKAGTEASSHLEQPTFCWRRSGPSRDLWGPKLSEDLEVSLVEGNMESCGVGPSGPGPQWKVVSSLCSKDGEQTVAEDKDA